MNILAIDDSPEQIMGLCQTLQGNGHFVSNVYSGREAMMFLELETPDVLLLDLMMDDMDGMEVLRALRKHPSAQDVPIIVITSNANESNHLCARSLGAQHVLTKPVQAQALEAVFNELH